MGSARVDARAKGRGLVLLALVVALVLLVGLALLLRLALLVVGPLLALWLLWRCARG